MHASVEELVCDADLDGGRFLEQLRRPGSASHVLVRIPGVDIGEEPLAAMLMAASAPMAATISPLPVPEAPERAVVVTPADPRLPPPPTLALACSAACLISREAIASIGSVASSPAGTDWRSAFVLLCQRLSTAGWRHVAAPGVALSWQMRAIGTADHGAWSPSLLAEQNGAANEGLSTHVLWARTQLRPPAVVVDGACLTDSSHNGSQAVVVNIAKALKRTRSQARVVLAVPAEHVAAIAAEMSASGVEVIARERGVSGFDVAYRPYQLLDPNELTWLIDAGQRLAVSQLDMIAFSNPSYHPSPPLFHAVRNLQRHTMRLADAVTFISDFGMQSAVAECPDVDATRCWVVGCGADPAPMADRRPPASTGGIPERFIACVSATFWHKNRQHAIAVFDELCRVHGYSGSLLIAGPEPYYGSSADDDDALLATVAPAIRDRVVRLGLVGEREKWWLLEHADLVLYPSLIEGFGLIPFEAAALGTPALAPDTAAIGEVLRGSRALVHSWSIAAWADAAAAMLSSADRSAEVVADIRQAATGLTWDATAEHTWQAIDATLARPRARRHAEEGGLASRVAGPATTLAPGARAAHFTNRLAQYLRRKFGR